MDDHHPGGGGGGSLPMSPSWRSAHFPPHSQMGWPLSMTLADLHDDTLLPTGLVCIGTVNACNGRRDLVWVVPASALGVNDWENCADKILSSVLD
ncbi:hypothetical protein MRX96_031538 [Rhipicephalus microplus]